MILGISLYILCGLIFGHSVWFLSKLGKLGSDLRSKEFMILGSLLWPLSTVVLTLIWTGFQIAHVVGNYLEWLDNKVDDYKENKRIAKLVKSQVSPGVVKKFTVK